MCKIQTMQQDDTARSSEECYVCMCVCACVHLHHLITLAACRSEHNRPFELVTHILLLITVHTGSSGLRPLTCTDGKNKKDDPHLTLYSQILIIQNLCRDNSHWNHVLNVIRQNRVSMGQHKGSNSCIHIAERNWE